MKKAFQLLGTLAICWLLYSSSVIVFNMYKYRYDFQDALWRYIYSFESETKFAGGFSEKKFAKIKNGMTEDEVMSLLGKPLQRNCHEYGCNWIYSWKALGHSDHFDLRSIHFDSQGAVEKIRHEFFLN